MIVEVRMTMKASRAKIWAALADIENAAELINGIEKIEIVESRGVIRKAALQDLNDIKSAVERV